MGHYGALWGTMGHHVNHLRLIPPYYRAKHRPNLTKDESGGFLRSLTVAQLRYVELSVLQVAAGLNGWAVIKEEKVPWGLYRWAFFDGYDDLQKYLLSMAIFYGENDD